MTREDVWTFDPPLATHHTQLGPSPNAKQEFLWVVDGDGLAWSFPSFLIDFHFLANQFAVKVPKYVFQAAL